MATKQEKDEWLPEHGSVKSEDAFKKIHKLSFRNKELLDLEWQACCFHCFSKFHPDKIKEWTDKGQTAVCPHCGIDSVLPGDFSSAILDEIYDRYFEFEI